MCDSKHLSPSTKFTTILHIPTRQITSSSIWWEYSTLFRVIAWIAWRVELYNFSVRIVSAGFKRKSISNPHSIFWILITLRKENKKKQYWKQWEKFSNITCVNDFIGFSVTHIDQPTCSSSHGRMTNLFPNFIVKWIIHDVQEKFKFPERLTPTKLFILVEVERYENLPCLCKIIVSIYIHGGNIW